MSVTQELAANLIGIREDCGQIDVCHPVDEYMPGHADQARAVRPKRCRDEPG
jgi:hypothetical protein